jgi:hypothetical protein
MFYLDYLRAYPHNYSDMTQRFAPPPPATQKQQKPLKDDDVDNDSS